MSLISTYDIRNWLGIEEADTTINPKLASISLAIESFVDSFTNRKMMANTYYNDIDLSYSDGTGNRYMYLPLYPVSYVSEVNIDADRTFASATVISTGDYVLYPALGKIWLEEGTFYTGRRNVKIGFTAGYAPVVNGTYNSSVSTYPVPYDLKQVMLEMAAAAYKEGITAVRTVVSQEGQARSTNMLTQSSWWRQVLIKYKAFDRMVSGRDE